MLLGGLDDLIADEVSHLLRSDDLTASYHVITGVVAEMTLRGIAALADDLGRFAGSPTPAEIAEELPEVAAAQLGRIG